MTVTAIQYGLEHYPGFVSFEFRDIYSKVWTITDKLPVIGLPYPKEGFYLPFEFEVPSQIINSYIDQNGKEVLRIKFFYNIESCDGESEFEVFSTDYSL